jgi:hypothetical protein
MLSELFGEDAGEGVARPAQMEVLNAGDRHHHRLGATFMCCASTW